MEQPCCRSGCKRPALSILVYYEGDNALDIPFCTQRKHGMLAIYFHNQLKKGDRNVPEGIDPERLIHRKLEEKLKHAEGALSVDHPEQLEVPVQEDGS